MSSRSNKEKCHKFKKICAKYLKSKKADIRMADIEIADINSAVINNADVKNLNAETFVLNGSDLTCALTQPSVATTSEAFYVYSGPTGATGPAPVPTNVDPIVYDALVENAFATRVDLQNRVAEGRNFINQYLADYPCPTSCPPPPTEPVPLEIYGTLTFPIYNVVKCGPTGATGSSFTQLNSAMGFNLQVDYLLEEANSIDARLVSVLVQVGYIDPLGPTGPDATVVIEEVFVANRQFYPTLDTLYGENFSNTISIPSNLILIAFQNSSNPNLQGAMQMVVYKEKGLCIWTPESGGSFECLKERSQNSTAQRQNMIDYCTGEGRQYICASACTCVGT